MIFLIFKLEQDLRYILLLSYIQPETRPDVVRLIYVGATRFFLYNDVKKECRMLLANAIVKGTNQALCSFCYIAV